MSNGILPKEKLTAYQRWELSSLDDPQPEPEEAPQEEDIPQVSLPTAEEIEQIHQQAHQEGFSAGYEEGRAKALQELQRIEQLRGELERALKEYDKQLEQDLLSLALGIAKQVIREALRIRPELVLPVVREAVASLPYSGQHVHLVLHPDDAALVRSLTENELAHLHCRIVEDGAMERGGCRIETAHSEIDATLQNRWDRVVATLGRNDGWLA
jgi:flagellar assembly protein FliH